MGPEDLGSTLGAVAVEWGFGRHCSILLFKKPKVGLVVSGFFKEIPPHAPTGSLLK